MRLGLVLAATASLLVHAPVLADPGNSVASSIGAEGTKAPGDRIMAALSHRLFPLFSSIGSDAAALRHVKTTPRVAAMLRTRADRRSACAQDLGCLTQAMVWPAAERSLLVAAIPQDLPHVDDGAAAQADREIVGVNVILQTFGFGQPPRYPQIDGSGLIDPLESRARLRAAEWLSSIPRAGSVQTLDPSFEFALALLDVSDRTDAIGFAPLAGGINAAAVKRASSLDWKRWRYTAMIVTGVGPETPDMPLSPYGKYHVRLAAERFARGDIALIIVTGGRAHPRATRFTEAEQMRTALIERYGVPADRIVVEPYARHTTTNLRNASRLLVELGAPRDGDALIVCNPDQSTTITSAAFTERNQTELGYLPGEVGKRVSPTEVEFRPSTASLRVDPRDPLDP